MKTTNKEFTKSDRPESGFYNVLLQRIYSKVDGIDVSKIDRVIEVVTISQLKDLSVDVAKYGIKNDQGLAGRFENTRNYIFPVDAVQNLLSKEDHATFKTNYDKAIKALEQEKKAAEKATDPVHKAVMSVVMNATVKTEEKQPDPVKSAIADVIPLNAAKTEKADSVKAEKAPAKTEKKVLPLSEKIIVSGSPKNKKIVEKAINDHLGKSEEKKPAEVVKKAEEKKPDVKPAEELAVSKSVTVDAAYIDKLIAATPVKKSGKKKSIKKSDLEQIAALF